MTKGRLGLELIKNSEGFKADAYLCPAGVWTIGYGHTKGVKRGDTCTPEEAETWLIQDIAEAEKAVNRLVTAPLTQNKFDALVDFVFNLGFDAFYGSTLRKKINVDPEDPTIVGEFGRWIYANGQRLPGLVRRRKAEVDLYFSEN